MFWKWKKLACEQVGIINRLRVENKVLNAINKKLIIRLEGFYELSKTNPLIKEIVELRLELQNKNIEPTKVFVSPEIHREILSLIPNICQSMHTIFGMLIVITREHRLRVE